VAVAYQLNAQQRHKSQDLVEDDGFPTPFGGHKKKDPNATRIQNLENLGDVSYFGVVSVGGQKVKAVIDTGSFELLVMGRNCTVCGENHLYDETKTKKGNTSAFEATHSFGSGTTYSVEAYDSLKVAGISVAAQQFWDVVDADMYILEDGAFQAILGVGPPLSAVKFAEDDQAEVHKEVAKLKKTGRKIDGEVQKIVDHYDEMATYMKNTKSVIEHLEIENMSVCLGKASGSAGFFAWNDHQSRDAPEKFLTLDVVGDYYWSAELGDVTLLHGTVPENATSKQSESLSKPIELGCTQKKCSAIVDTGTSLIVAPTSVVDKVYDLADAWENAGGTCDDLGKLPHFRFTMNGAHFSLPPEAYMGLVDGSLHESLKDYMPRLPERWARKKAMIRANVSTSVCEPLLMTMDADSQFGELWILGMPFFRKYYTSFQFVIPAKDPEPGAAPINPKAATMSFSVVDDKCQPEVSPGTEDGDDEMLNLHPEDGEADDAGEGSESASHRKRAPRPATLRIDASRLHVPRLVKGKIKFPGYSLAESSVERPFVQI